MLLSKATCIPEPYPHCIVENALDDGLYKALLESRPKDELISLGSLESNVRHDIPARDIPSVGVWWKFIRYHTSRAFWQDVMRVFGEHIRERYPQHLDPTVGIRKTGPYDIAAECQVSVNTPCTSRSRVVGPHLDNTRSLYAGMLYMGDEGGGDFEIRRYTKMPVFYGKSRIEDDCTEIVTTVPYRHNTFVMFINCPEAVHSVSERDSKEYRRFVNVAGETQKPLFGVKDE